MTVGIPRAFLYYKYRDLWETFFQELGVEIVLSPETNKRILDMGNERAIGEACLSSKIYLGHVAHLVGKCDCILVARTAEYLPGGKMCTKFMAIYDLVANTFRDEKPELLHYSIDAKGKDLEFNAFMRMGRSLGKKRAATARAYMLAKQAQWQGQLAASQQMERLFEEKGLKILVVAHSYNLHDKYIGKPVFDTLRQLGATPIPADAARRSDALAACNAISESLPWVENRELVGAIELNRRRIHGIVLMSSFPCGPDSLVNEVLIRRVKELPILNLVVDGQEGSAGLETRLESFVDILNFKREEYDAQ